MRATASRIEYGFCVEDQTTSLPVSASRYASAPRVSIGTPASRAWRQRSPHDDVGCARAPARRRPRRPRATWTAALSGQSVVKARGRGQRRLGRHQRGERLVVHGDALERVGQAIGVVGDDHGHRLAHVADEVAGEDGGRERAALVRPFGPGQDRARRLGQVAGAHAATTPGAVRAALSSTSGDARVGMEASHDAEVQRPRAREVVQVAARPDEEAAIFLPSRRAADQVAGLVHAAQCNRPWRAEGRAARLTSPETAAQCSRSARHGRQHSARGVTRSSDGHPHRLSQERGPHGRAPGRATGDAGAGACRSQGTTTCWTTSPPATARSASPSPGAIPSRSWRWTGPPCWPSPRTMRARPAWPTATARCRAARSMWTMGTATTSSCSPTSSITSIRRPARGCSPRCGRRSPREGARSPSSSYRTRTASRPLSPQPSAS